MAKLATNNHRFLWTTYGNRLKYYAISGRLVAILRLWRSCLEILLTKIAGIASSEECATCSMWERGKLLYPLHLCGKHGLAEGMSLDMLYVLMYCLILYDFVTVWLMFMHFRYGGQVVSHLSFPCVFFHVEHVHIYVYIHTHIYAYDCVMVSCWFQCWIWCWCCGDRCSLYLFSFCCGAAAVVVIVAVGAVAVLRLSSFQPDLQPRRRQSLHTTMLYVLAVAFCTSVHSRAWSIAVNSSLWLLSGK
jgi:hypothetical protein